MTASKELFPVVERVDVDSVVIAAFTREWDFMVLGSELLREVTSSWRQSSVMSTLAEVPAIMECRVERIFDLIRRVVGGS